MGHARLHEGREGQPGTSMSCEGQADQSGLSELTFLTFVNSFSKVHSFIWGGSYCPVIKVISADYTNVQIRNKIFNFRV